MEKVTKARKSENVFDILHVHATPKIVTKALRNLFFALRNFFIEKVTKATCGHPKKLRRGHKKLRRELGKLRRRKKTQYIYDFARFRTLEKSYEEPKQVTKGIEQVTKALRNFFETPS